MRMTAMSELVVTYLLMKWMLQTHTKEPLLKLPRPAPSLLKKLLASEVHREFSAVLQCFRHMVQNHAVVSSGLAVPASGR